MKKYDFICPIGESCIASYRLRESLLQIESYPFDWLMDCKLDNFIHYLQTDFCDFLIKENLELYKDIPPTNCEHYKDLTTGTLFVHCFKKNASLDEDFIMVNKIFQRRIKRFRNRIKQSKRILFVYVSKTDLYNDGDLLLKAEKIFQSFNKKHIDLLYIVTVNEHVFKETYLSQKVKKVEMQYKDEYSICNREWKGISKLFHNVFSKIKLSKQIAYRKKFLKTLAVLIPSKKLRKKARYFVYHEM
jgi:hypothetical protein